MRRESAGGEERGARGLLVFVSLMRLSHFAECDINGCDIS